MAQSAKYASIGSFTDILTTELNSVSTGANTSASSAVGNATTKLPLMALRLDLAAQGSSRTAGGNIAVYIVPSLDGSTYSGVNESIAEPVATFTLDAATTAWKEDRYNIPIPPFDFKLFARNNTGQSTAASSSKVSYVLYSIDPVAA